MIVPDVNLLLYATITGFAQHERARTWWEGVLNADREVGLAGPAIFGFLRIATNPRVLTEPMAVDRAVAEVRRWLGRPQVRFLVPGAAHLDLTFELLAALGTAANLTTDAQLAALAIENEAELHSNDGDFARFGGLRWVNPLK